MKSNAIWFLFFLAIGVALGFFITKSSITPDTIVVKETKRDTLIVEKHYYNHVIKEGSIDSIFINENKELFLSVSAETTFVDSSLYDEKIGVTYKYPENVFKISSDLKIKDKTVIVEKEIEVKDKSMLFSSGGVYYDNSNLGLQIGAGILINEKYYIGAFADSDKKFGLNGMTRIK